MKRFIIQSTVLTIIIFVIGAVVYSTILRPYYLAILPFTVLFFYFVTNLVHAYLLKISGKASARFSSQYMASSFVKMFFYLGVAIVYMVLHKEVAKIFISNFLVLYILYTGIEVYEFTRFIREKGN